MKFTCHTTYDQKARAAMARAIRKTVGAERRRALCRRGWIVAGLLLVSWGTLWKMMLSGGVIGALALTTWKEGALSGYFPRGKELPGAESVHTIFCCDHYLVETAGTRSQWRYDGILALAQTRDYLILLVGRDQAQAVEKAGLEGGDIEEFRRFLEEKSGRKIQDVGG